MRSRLAVLVAVTSVLTVVSPAFAGRPHTEASDWAFVRYELWDTPLPAFIAATTHPDPWFDWSTDGCSAPLLGGHGFAYDFRAPCRRHDFGYRNMRRLEQRYGTGRTYWNATNRAKIDRQFLTDMRSTCHHRIAIVRPICSMWAVVYYLGVRRMGGP
jgi:hypothetical protein